MAAEEKQRKTKRQKTHDPNEIFKNFLTDTQKMEQLTAVCEKICKGFSMMNMRLLQIVECNARISESFCRASCTISAYEEAGTFAVGDIFSYGLDILEKFTDKSKPKIPVDENQRMALKKLLEFFYQDHSAILEYEGCKDESEWSVILAQHLLYPLSVGKNYKFDHQSYSSDNKCPCPQQDELNGQKGDTSFGCIKGWHGRSDILINDVVPVGCTGGTSKQGDGDTESVSSFSSTDLVKFKDGKEGFDQKDLAQMISETIVFSFLQCKLNKERMYSCLVPGIGISNGKVKCFFYDCEADVLLETAEMDLKIDLTVPKISQTAVVLLWLTINYQIFCSGISDKMKKYNAQFFERVGDHLDFYRNETAFEVHKPYCPRNPRKKENWFIDEPVDQYRQENLKIKYEDLRVCSDTVN